MKRQMKSAVLTNKRTVEIMLNDLPKTSDERILVNTKACGLCTWEMRAYKGIHKVDYPIIGGHEMAGEIVNVPKQYEKQFRVGEKVVIGSLQPCRSCHFCKQHHEEACIHFDTLRQLEDQPYKGQAGLSEFTSVKPESLFPFSNVSYEEACFCEPLGCVIQSVEMINPQFGETALIIGAGIMGQLHAQLCLKKGLQVLLVDEKEERLALAKSLGVHHTINFKKENVVNRVLEYTDQIGARYIFDTTPIAGVIEDCFKYVSRRGKIMIYSGIYPNKKISIDPHFLHKNSIQIMGTANASDVDFTKASYMISHHIINVKPFISGIYKIDQVKEAFEDAVSHDVYRNIVTF